MRKLFAMVATVAVVLSMFSGIAFAVNSPIHTIVLTSEQSVVTTGETTGFYFVKGEVHKNGTKLDVTDAPLGTRYRIEVTKPDGVTKELIPLTNGAFAYAVPTGTAPGLYTFENYDVIDGIAANDFTEATFAVKAIVEIKKTSYDYKASPLEVVELTLRDVNGNALKVAKMPASVALDNASGAASVGSITPADGSMAFLVTNWGAGAPGELTLKLNGVEHGTIKVGDVAALTLTADPAYAIKAQVDTRIVFKATGPKSLTGGIFSAYKYNTGTGNWDAYNLFSGPAATTAANLNADGEFKLDMVHKFATAGSYKVEFTKAAYTKAVANITVVTGTEGVVETIKTNDLKEIPVGPTTITCGSAATDDYEVVPLTAAGAVDVTKSVLYTVYVDDVIKAEQVAAPSVSLNPTKLGDVKVRIATYLRDTATGAITKKLDKLFTVAVTGMDVTYDVKTLVVNQAQNITFVVKDKDGNPVNNAMIYAETVAGDQGTRLVPASANIVNGTYVAKDVKYTSPTTKIISVYLPTSAADKLVARFATGLRVYGENTYTVSSNVETLLAGKKQTVTFTVKNGDSSFIPAKAEMQVGDTVTPLTLSVSGSNVKADVQNDTTKDAVIRVMNGAGDKCGEIVLKTVAPKVVMTTEQKYVTENIYTALKFSVIDPRDDSTLVKPVVITPVNVPTVDVKTADKNGTLTTTLDASAEQNVNVLVSGIDWDAVNDFGDKVTLDIKVTLDATVKTDTSLEVKKAEITASPDTVILGQPANVTLTYKDANGNIISGKKVYFGYVDNANKGTEIGTTDANGQIVYASTAQSSSALTFGFATDISTKQIKKTVASTLDNSAPVVTAPATTDKSTATITISDNVRVTTLYVNGVKVDVIPRASITHVVTLKQGVNTIDIVAIDTNYNVVEQTVTITYTPAANNSTVLQGSAVARKGDNLFVQVAQFEKLGATKSWNATTKTATFTAGGKTVEVTIGSTIAKVNGATVTMPAAPYIANNLTMVPTRFISEALGWTVNWAAGDVVTITLP